MNAINKRCMTIVFIVFMFCAIFTPDFFHFSMRYLLVILAGGYITWDIFIKRRMRISSNELLLFKGFIPFIIYFSMLQIFRSMIDPSNSGIYINTLVHTLFSFIGAFIICEFILCVSRKLNLSFDSFVKIMFAVSLMQFVCVLLALTIPSIRYYFNTLIVKNSYSDRLAELAEASNRGFVDRSYGLSNNLFDSFGYITALIILLLYTNGLEKKNNKIIIVSFIMIIMPLVNARTGVILLVLGFLVVNLFYHDIKNVLKIIGIVALALVVFSQLLTLLPDSMIKWLSGGLDDILLFFSGSDESTVFSKILGEDLIYPNSILLGAGGSSSSFNYHGVDNGYINCIWNFGLIGTVLLLFGYIRMFKMVYNKSDYSYNKAISVAYTVIFFVYLVKIYSIDNFGGNTLIFGISSMLLVTYKNQLSNNFEVSSE